jgi:hypothetical protein
MECTYNPIDDVDPQAVGQLGVAQMLGLVDGTTEPTRADLALRGATCESAAA